LCAGLADRGRKGQWAWQVSKGKVVGMGRPAHKAAMGLGRQIFDMASKAFIASFSRPSGTNRWS
jgi:hypothetical protein